MSLMEYHVKGPDDVSGVSQVYKHLLCYNGLDLTADAQINGGLY
jgi:hypothetical protein